MKVPDGEWPGDSCEPPISRLETALLGSLIVIPEWMDRAAILNDRDFGCPARAQMFDVMRSFPKRSYEPTTLYVELYRQHVPTPTGLDWPTALAWMMDLACVTEDEFDTRVRMVKEEAAMRRAKR